MLGVLVGRGVLVKVGVRDCVTAVIVPCHEGVAEMDGVSVAAGSVTGNDVGAGDGGRVFAGDAVKVAGRVTVAGMTVAGATDWQPAITSM